MLKAVKKSLYCGLVLIASSPLPVSAAACGDNAAQYGKPGCPYPSFGTYLRPTPCRIVRRGFKRVRVCGSSSGYPDLK